MNQNTENKKKTNPIYIIHPFFFTILGKTEGLTSFQGLFSKASSGPPSEASATNADDSSTSKQHKIKKKKKKNRHKHKHKHKHERPDKPKDRQDSFSMPSPMIGSVQSLTSVSSVDAAKDSGPSSPEFEVI